MLPAIQRAVFFGCLMMSALGFAEAALAQDTTLTFEVRSVEDPDRPSGWDIRGAGHEVTLDTIAHEGTLSLRLAQTRAGGYAVASRTVSVDSLPGTRIRISGYVRTRDVQGGTARLWVLVQGPGQPMLYADDMPGRGAAGTQEWTRFTIEAPIFPEAAQLQFGVILSGTGTAWFDELTLEADVAAAAPMVDSVRAYLAHALELMQTHSVRRDSIDWPAFRSTILGYARGAQRPADVHPILEYAVRRLEDGHSFFRRPPQTRVAGMPMTPAGAGAAGPMPAGTLAGARVGYVWVPEFAGADTLRARAFADSLQQIIRRLDEDGVCGWVVDLRGNPGGNMWPMLAGLGPLVDEDTAGWFRYPDGTREAWGYREGASVLAGREMTHASTSYELGEPDAPVAVLTGPMTLSSGEAIAVAFRGRAHTRSFGEGTGGKSTSNRTFHLSDGGTLAITSAVFVDRTGRAYGGVIEPDVTVQSDRISEPSPDDAVVAAARAWLESQLACAPVR